MKLILLGLLALCATLVLSVPVDNDNDNEAEYTWEQYVQDHNLSFTPEEIKFRKELFRRHKDHVKSHNKKHKSGNVPFKVGFNKFSVMTQDEKDQHFGGKFDIPEDNLRRNRRGIGTSNMVSGNTSNPIYHLYTYDSTVLPTLPASVDLRSKGWNEPVQDQGQCGSCWAFSSSSLLSYITFNKTGLNAVMSQQNLVDCDGIWGAQGCNGASPVFAMEYFQMQKVTTAAAYPYKGVQSACNTALLSTAKLYGITGFLKVNSDTNSLKQALALIAPVIVGIDANTLMNYKSGIWTGLDTTTNKMCTTTSNHAVLVIGYGTDATLKKDYWLVKNSWGTSWGEAGFFRMERTTASTCGLLSYMYTAL